MRVLPWASAVTLAVVMVGCKAERAAPRGTSVPQAAAPAGDASAAAQSEEPTVAPELTGGKDVLAEMQRRNSDAYASPPTKFRTGHVTPRKLDGKALKKKAHGFVVQMPSGAPIVTPAFHDGLVVTSGGFHSKEIYAFAAHTGELAWGLSLDDDGPSAPACRDEVCVFNTESCTVFAVAAKTGELLWSWWLGDPLMSAPTIADGLVFTSFPAQGNTDGSRQASQSTTRDAPPGMTHALAAFDLHTGELAWSRWIDADVMSAPVAVGDAVFATTFAGTIFKIDQRSGELLAARHDRATSAPVVTSNEVYYTRRDEQAGEEAAEAVVRSSVDEKKSFVAAKKRARYLDRKVQRKSKIWLKGKSLDASNGFSGGAPQSANAGVAEGLVGQGSVSTLQAFQGSWTLHYRGSNVNAMGDEIVSTDAETGAQRWTRALDGDLADAGGFLATPPLAAGGSLFVATLKGQVLQLDPDSGKVQRRFDVGAPVRSQPVVDHGWLYVGTDTGQLVGIDLGDDRFTGWSHWGGNAARTGRSE
jgi:outer membrane protein assembly factor BamB